MMAYVHLAVAGLGPLIWHWGLGIGLIIVLLGLAFASFEIPFLGPLLDHERKWLIVAAAIIGAVLFGEGIGVHDKAYQDAAKNAVIEKHVDDVVQSTDTPKAQKQRDPYDVEDSQ